MDATGAKVSFENVEVQYGRSVTALRGVTFDVEPGEFLFLVGRTGSGKSTLLKLLTREIIATAGRVLISGADVAKIREGQVPSLRRGMGVVPQDFGLLPNKRVWENVAYAMRAVGATKQEIRREVPEILERVNVLHRAEAFPHQLSGGEQQRVAIGRALINNPPLLLADEPTGNLDPDHSLEIMELLAQLNTKGATILVASHDFVVVDKMNKRVVTLEHGSIALDVIPDA